MHQDYTRPHMDIQKGIEDDMFMTSFDLTQMYDGRDSRVFFCFKVRDEKTGKPKYYKWKVLVFSNKKAVEITKDILKTFVKLMRERIIIYLYIDEGLQANANKTELVQSTQSSRFKALREQEAVSYESLQSLLG